jgi:hypothetical protein
MTSQSVFALDRTFGTSVGNGLCAVPHLLNPFTTMRNATEGVPYRLKTGFVQI